MFRSATKGIKAKQLDELGNEVSFDVREDEEMVRRSSFSTLFNAMQFKLFSALQIFFFTPFSRTLKIYEKDSFRSVCMQQYTHWAIACTLRVVPFFKHMWTNPRRSVEGHADGAGPCRVAPKLWSCWSVWKNISYFLPSSKRRRRMLHHFIYFLQSL